MVFLTTFGPSPCPERARTVTNSMSMLNCWPRMKQNHDDRRSQLGLWNARDACLTGSVLYQQTCLTSPIPSTGLLAWPLCRDAPASSFPSSRCTHTCAHPTMLNRLVRLKVSFLSRCYRRSTRGHTSCAGFGCSSCTTLACGNAGEFSSESVHYRGPWWLAVW